MTDRPIIFSGPMVRALLGGEKTQTRRLATSPLRRCDVGDRLYVRESWKPHSLYAGMKPRDIPETTVFYFADNKYAPSDTPWIPSIHMPRWASRLTLIVTDVRFQALQAISEADAVAEGVDAVSVAEVPRRAAWSRRQDFSRLWDSLHAAPHAWDDNPDLVALTFKVERRNIDAETP